MMGWDEGDGVVVVLPSMQEDGVAGLEEPAKTRRSAGELIFCASVLVVFGVVGVTGSRLRGEPLVALVMTGVEGGRLVSAGVVMGALHVISASAEQSSRIAFDWCGKPARRHRLALVTLRKPAVRSF